MKTAICILGVPLAALVLLTEKLSGDTTATLEHCVAVAFVTGIITACGLAGVAVLAVWSLF